MRRKVPFVISYKDKIAGKRIFEKPESYVERSKFFRDNKDILFDKYSDNESEWIFKNEFRPPVDVFAADHQDVVQDQNDPERHKAVYPESLSSYYRDTVHSLQSERNKIESAGGRLYLSPNQQRFILTPNSVVERGRIMSSTEKIDKSGKSYRVFNKFTDRPWMQLGGRQESAQEVMSTVMNRQYVFSKWKPKGLTASTGRHLGHTRSAEYLEYASGFERENSKDDSYILPENIVKKVKGVTAKDFTSRDFQRMFYDIVSGDFKGMKNIQTKYSAQWGVQFPASGIASSTSFNVAQRGGSVKEMEDSLKSSTNRYGGSSKALIEGYKAFLDSPKDQVDFDNPPRAKLSFDSNGAYWDMPDGVTMRRDLAIKVGKSEGRSELKQLLFE